MNRTEGNVNKYIKTIFASGLASLSVSVTALYCSILNRESTSESTYIIRALIRLFIVGQNLLYSKS